MNFEIFNPLEIPLDGTNHIEASAGTGKTYNITTIYLRLIIESGLKIGQILVVTFTEAATAELRDRIRSKLEQALDCLHGHCDSEDLLTILKRGKDAQEKLELAKRSFDEAAIFTIHGFCNRMLHENAFESGVLFDTELLANQQQLMDEIVADYWAKQTIDAHALFIRYLKENKHNMDTLSDLLRNVVSQPARIIVPGSIEPVAAGESYQEAFEQTRNIWQRHAKDIVRILQETWPGLNGRSYPKHKLNEYVESIKYAMDSGQTQLPQKDNWITKLATGNFKPKKGKDAPRHEFFDACERLCDLESLFRKKVLWFRLNFIRYAIKQLAIRKEQRNLQSYDDMLTKLHAACGPEGNTALAKAIREKYKAALIDEFQDTDTIQSEIFTRLFSDHETPMFQIGDPKQSIYGFRGADVFSYTRAAKLATKHYTMETNWRSDPSLISGINFLFGRMKDPFMSKDISYRDVKPRDKAKDAMRIDGHKVTPLRIRFIPKQGRPATKPWALQNIPKLVALDIVDLLKKHTVIGPESNEPACDKKARPIEANDIAVLVRTNNQALAVQEALGKQGIVSVRTGDSSVFLSTEANELSIVLSAIANPTDSVKIKTALATNILGLDAEEIFKLQEDEKNNDLEWENWIVNFHSWRATWQESGFVRMFRNIMKHKAPGKKLSNMARLIGLWDGQRRVTNLLHLSELLQKASSELKIGPEGLVQWLEKKRTSNTMARDESQLRLESDLRAVNIVTVFKAKGLEYPVVFCPYFWDGYLRTSNKDLCPFHDPDDGFVAKLDIGKNINANRKQEKTELMAENMRLLYVGLTRAKHMCVITWGYFTGSENSPLAHLLSSNEDSRSGKKLEDKESLQKLKELEKSSGGSLEILPVELPLVEQRASEPTDKAHVQLSYRPIQRHIQQTLMTFSYSGMLNRHQKINPAQQQGLDHDEQALPSILPTLSSNIPEEKIPSLDLPRGSRVGNMLHSILEELDFSSDDPQLLQTIVRQKLDSFGIDATYNQMVCEMIRDSIDTNIIGQHPEFALRYLPKQKTFREMHFWMPAGVSGPQLVKIFRDNPSKQVPQDYIQTLERLNIQSLRGFLQGYIDLVFKYKNRWYVVDYKSNFLGENFCDYQKKSLPTHMSHSHYYLQYHLYVLALHRYLNFRLHDYEYNEHMGGVFYLFLRGMSPKRGFEYGVFDHKPSKKIIMDLNQLMDKNLYEEGS